jgi:hypothetical protein
MPEFLYRYYIIDDKRELTGSNTSQKSNNWELLLGAGYYHTFVLKRSFYISLGLTPAAGFIFTWLTTRSATASQTDNQQNFIFRWDTRLGLGYNGERFFTGLYTRAFGASYNQQSTVINSEARITAQLFLGYRFNAPKWLRKEVEKVEKLIKL